MNPRDEAILTYCIKRSLEYDHPKDALVRLIQDEFNLVRVDVHCVRGRGGSWDIRIYLPELSRDVIRAYCEARYEYERPPVPVDFSGHSVWARDMMVSRVMKWSVEIRSEPERTYRPPREPVRAALKCACGADLPTYATRCAPCINLDLERHAIEKAQRDRVEKVKSSVDFLVKVCLEAGHMLWLGIDDTSKRYMMLDFEPGKVVAADVQEAMVLEL